MQFQHSGPFGYAGSVGRDSRIHAEEIEGRQSEHVGVYRVQRIDLLRLLTAACGTSRTCPDVRVESAMRSKADIARQPY